MKILILSISKLFLLYGLILIWILIPANAQEFTLEQIQNSLLINSPNTGNTQEREETILALDSILLDNSSTTSQEVLDFYSSMMEKVNEELKEDVSGEATIWMMYNHGFVIKTSELVFAFDLVNGYPGWASRPPSELLKQIDVLFISHRHIDHYDKSVSEAVMANGGTVVYPSGQQISGNFPMEVGDSSKLLGLDIKAYSMHHIVPGRIFEVVCPNGLKFLHTGDNQVSDTLPAVDSLDVLLLNAWVNESGSSTAVVGMRNCLSKLYPKVMIPGHIQELAHDYIPDKPTTRIAYEWAFEVDDVPLITEVQVMAWGEQYIVEEEPASPPILSVSSDIMYQPDSIEIDLSSFRKGVYFITIRSKDFLTIKKIIKL